jgi:UDP-glucose:glycoprotein glucosyltransferase
MLHTLSENFPLYAGPLARKVSISDSVRDEVHGNWGKAQMGVNMAWVNGRVLQGEVGIFGYVAFLLLRVYSHLLCYTLEFYSILT